MNEWLVDAEKSGCTPFFIKEMNNESSEPTINFSGIAGIVFRGVNLNLP